jgi:hypothetical protein
MLCTAVLREMGLPVPHLELGKIGENLCVVSKRFDRWGEGAEATRLHQETFWQALGIPPGAENAEEEADRPGFHHSCELLREIGEEESVETLFTVGFCNFLLGNDANAIVQREDVHGRNSALLSGEDGPLLAPFCDIVSTDVYGDPPSGATLVEYVERSSAWIGVVRLGLECEYEPQPTLFRALETTSLLCQKLTSVANRAVEEGWYQPVMDDISALVRKRLGRLTEELQFVVRGPNGETLPEFPLD